MPALVSSWKHQRAVDPLLSLGPVLVLSLVVLQTQRSPLVSLVPYPELVRRTEETGIWGK